MQSAHLADEFVPGTQVEVVCVCQQNRHTEILGEVSLGEPFDRGLGANRHEHRGFDAPDAACGAVLCAHEL